jgi:AAA ATPase domain
VVFPPCAAGGVTPSGATPHICGFDPYLWDRRPYPARAAMCGGGRLDQVADQFGVARRPLVGRAGEIDAITRLLQDAAGGRGGALLISGEAGVGKTALVREASSQVGEAADVLWAPCLPLTSLAVPFLPP